MHAETARGIVELVEQRFWARVRKSNGCWEWTGHRHYKGYGVFKAPSSKLLKAHRFSWELERGPIPDGLCVLHCCDNPPCVRPDHLWLGTNAENMADMVAKGRSQRRCGSSVAGSKLTVLRVQSIRAAAAAGGLTYKEIGQKFGVGPACVWQVVRRVTWKHVP